MRHNLHPISLDFCAQTQKMNSVEANVCLTLNQVANSSWMVLLVRLDPHHKRHTQCTVVKQMKKDNKHQIVTGSRTIIEDVLIWSNGVSYSLIMFECVCKVFIRYRVLFKVKKSAFLLIDSSMPDEILWLQGIQQPGLNMV